MKNLKDQTIQLEYIEELNELSSNTSGDINAFNKKRHVYTKSQKKLDHKQNSYAKSGWFIISAIASFAIVIQLGLGHELYASYATYSLGSSASEVDIRQFATLLAFLLLLFSTGASHCFGEQSYAFKNWYQGDRPSMDQKKSLSGRKRLALVCGFILASLSMSLTYQLVSVRGSLSNAMQTSSQVDSFPGGFDEDGEFTETADLTMSSSFENVKSNMQDLQVVLFISAVFLEMIFGLHLFTLILYLLTRVRDHLFYRLPINWRFKKIRKADNYIRSVITEQLPNGTSLQISELTSYNFTQMTIACVTRAHVRNAEDMDKYLTPIDILELPAPIEDFPLNGTVGGELRAV